MPAQFYSQRGRILLRVATLADVYDERDPLPITQVITPTSVPGLDLIPSSIDLIDVEPDLGRKHSVLQCSMPGFSNTPQTALITIGC